MVIYLLHWGITLLRGLPVTRELRVMLDLRKLGGAVVVVVVRGRCTLVELFTILPLVGMVDLIALLILAGLPVAVELIAVAIVYKAEMVVVALACVITGVMPAL